jgi:HAD superfamily phosphatase (TIGR01668 family)
MLKKLIPSYYLADIYALTIKDLKALEVDILFFDLDNTLDPFYNKVPSLETTTFIQNFLANDIKVFVLSNNHQKRIKTYCESLHIPYLFHCYKPFKHKINKFIIHNGFSRANILLVGDQILTDIICANSLKIKSLLVEPYVKTDLKKTMINRFIDKKIRKKMKEKGLLKSINEN